MKHNLVSACIPSEKIQPGDYLDITGKTKVYAARMIGQYFTVAYKTRGSRSGNIKDFQPGHIVRVWRRERTWEEKLCNPIEGE